MSSDFWQKAEKIARKVNGYVEKRYEATNAQYEAKKAEYHRILSTKTDDEIRRMKQNPKQCRKDTVSKKQKQWERKFITKSWRHWQRQSLP